MISITQDFSLDDLNKDLQGFEEEMKLDIVRALAATLKEMVDTARAKTKSEGGFGNITWNLRASIGGVIMMDHKIVETYFPPIGQGDEGHEKGLGYAIDVAELQDDGDIILVFVAGMDYAYYVEAKDVDVISGSSIMFEEVFKAALGR